MNVIFNWLDIPPGIDQEPWDQFIQAFSLIFPCLIGASVVVIVGAYWLSARRRRIYHPSDVFRIYTPMLALFYSLLGGVVAAIVAGSYYQNILSTSNGLLSTATQIFGAAVLTSALVAFLIIKLTKGFLTPITFRNRV